MAKVFVVQKEREADVKIFNCSKDRDADLHFFKVDKERDAKGDALWYFVEKEREATVKVFWVEKERDADIKVFKVDKSSYYNWVKNGCVIQKVDEKLNELIEIIFLQSRQTYGTRRIKDKLLERYGVIVSRKRIRNILKQLGLFVKMKRRFKVMTTDSNHNLPIAPNILNRDFYASKVDEKYVGDITYIPTSEGWLYLATVIDLYSRKIVGWSMDETMKVSLGSIAITSLLPNYPHNAQVPTTKLKAEITSEP